MLLINNEGQVGPDYDGDQDTYDTDDDDDGTCTAGDDLRGHCDSHGMWWSWCYDCDAVGNWFS